MKTETLSFIAAIALVLVVLGLNFVNAQRTTKTPSLRNYFSHGIAIQHYSSIQGKFKECWILEPDAKTCMVYTPHE